MDDEMAMNMKSMDKHADDGRQDDRILRYRRLLAHSLELGKQKEKIFAEMTKTEKMEVHRHIQEEWKGEVADDLTVPDVAELLKVSEQMVRRYCAEGKLEAFRRNHNSGQWRIPSYQFIAEPGYIAYLHKKEKERLNAIKAAEIMVELFDSEDGEKA